MTSFFDQFSLWQIVAILAGLVLGQTLLFRLVLNWDRSHPVDEVEPAGAQSGVPSLASASGAGVSFSTSSRGSRPRRRKHLQQAEAAAAASAPEPPATDSDQAAGVQSYPSWPPTEPALETAHPLPAPASAEENSRPPVAFTSSSDPVAVPVPPLEAGETDRPAQGAIAFSEDNHAHPASESAPVFVSDSTPGEPEPAVSLAEAEPPPVFAAEPFPAALPVPEIPSAPEPAPVLAAMATTAPGQPVPDSTDVKPAQPSTPTADLMSAPIILVESGSTSLQSTTSTKVEGMNSDTPPAEAPPMDPKPPEAAAPPAHEPEPAPAAFIPEAPTPIRPPTTTPLIRRAVGPPRLFLTREFSSLRIRSGSVTKPPASPDPVPPAAAEAQPPVPEAKSVPADEISTVSAAEPATSSQPAEVPAEAPGTPLNSIVPVPPVEEDPAPLTLSAGPVEPVPLESVVPISSLPPAIEEPTHAVVVEHSPEPTHPERAEEPAPSEAPVPELSQPPVETVAESGPEPETPATLPPAPELPAPALEEPQIQAENEVPVPAIDLADAPAIVPPVSSDPTIHHPPLAPTQTHMTTVQPSTGERASAQLTLSFEVSSLQLTPAFKLGSVQLKPLSNVVSLQLGASDGPQPAANPLAANVSFEILSVQTGGNNHVQSLVLRPLPQAQAATTPQPRLQVDAVQLTRGVENAPIQITPAQQTSTAVQVLATYTVVGIDFTPLFEIGSMRLEPNSNTVLLRLSSPSQGGMADLPPVFELASVQVGADGQISLVQLTPVTV